MADIYDAELQPDKLDVLSAWIPKQSWANGLDLDAAPLERITAFRFDDPAGEVGIEVRIVRTGDRVFQIPLTYRGAPLHGADDAFISEMDHSVLGRRWVYDGTADPVFVEQLVDTISESGSSAAQFLVDEDGNRTKELTEVARAFGTGSCAGVRSFEVEHELELDSPAAADAGRLLGTWDGQMHPVLLATLV